MSEKNSIDWNREMSSASARIQQQHANKALEVLSKTSALEEQRAAQLKADEAAIRELIQTTAGDLDIEGKLESIKTQVWGGRGQVRVLLPTPIYREVSPSNYVADGMIPGGLGLGYTHTRVRGWSQTFHIPRHEEVVWYLIYEKAEQLLSVNIDKDKLLVSNVLVSVISNGLGFPYAPPLEVVLGHPQTGRNLIEALAEANLMRKKMRLLPQNIEPIAGKIDLDRPLAEAAKRKLGEVHRSFWDFF